MLNLTRFIVLALLSASLVSFTGATGCQMNSDVFSGGSASQGQTTCASATTVFDSSDAAVTLAQLPSGTYSHASTEIYFERTETATPLNRIARVQYLEAPTGRAADPYSIALRCRETQSDFRSIFTQASVITDFSKLASGLYDSSASTYALSFSAATFSNLVLGDGGDLRSASAALVANTISSSWSGGYHFTHPTGETYYFFGTRYENGLTIRVKAAFTRTNL